MNHKDRLLVITRYYLWYYLEAPQFIRGLHDMNNYVKDKIVFDCSISNYNIKVDWTKNGVKLQNNNPKYEFISEGKTLY